MLNLFCCYLLPIIRIFQKWLFFLYHNQRFTSENLYWLKFYTNFWSFLQPVTLLWYSLLENTPSKILNHLETSQSNCQSIDWFPHNTSLLQKYLQTDFNETFQGVKKKKRKSLVKPGSYSESHQKPRQRPFLKSNKPLKPVLRKLHPRCSTGLWIRPR